VSVHVVHVYTLQAGGGVVTDWLIQTYKLHQHCLHNVYMIRHWECGLTSH